MAQGSYSTPCGCHKRRYRTYRIALRVLLHATERRGTALRIYRCPVKEGFHLTSRPTWPGTTNTRKENNQ